MRFLKLATNKRTLLGAIGVAGGAVALDAALTAVIPVVGTSTSGALAAATPYAREFLKGLYVKFGELWTNHRVSEEYESKAAPGRDPALNHDLELAVGRTLATLTKRWAERNGRVVGAAVEDLSARLNQLEGDRPKWSVVAEAIAFPLDDRDLVDVALGGEGRTGELAKGWGKLLQELMVEFDGDPKVAGHDEVWTKLGAFLAREFAGQFRIDVKRALDAHPEAWAALQLGIDRVVLDHIFSIEREVKSTHAAVDETRRTVIDLGARCARRLARTERNDDTTRDILREIQGQLDWAKRELERQALRPPLELSIVEAADTQLARLHFTARRVLFTGREAELERLRTFLGHEGDSSLRWRKFAWWLWTGPGGMGKSRLALELALEAEEVLGWDAGFFLRKSHEKFDAHEWARWIPTRPTLVVFDYAAERAAEIVSAIGKLHARDAGGEFKHPIRFLLLEREHTSERLISAMTHAAEGGDAIAVSNAAAYGENRELWHVELQPLPDEILLDALARLFAEKKKVLDREAMLTMLRRRDERGRVVPEGNPLFAAVLAETVIESGYDKVRNDSAADLLRRVLSNEVRHWKSAGVDPVHLNWLVYATILRRPVDLPEAWPQDIAPLLPSENAGRSDLCDQLSSYGSRAERGPCSMLPLEPDRFGELLVLDRLAGAPEVSLGGGDNAKFSGRVTRELLLSAWMNSPDAVIEFAARTTDDWTRHPQCQALLELPFKSSPTDHRRRSLWLLGEMYSGAWKWGRLDLAAACAARCLELARRWHGLTPTPESRRDVSLSLNSVAQIELARGRHDVALKLYSESLELSRALASELGTPESRRDVSVALTNVAEIELERGRHAAALKLYSESLEIRRALASELGTPGSRRDVSASLGNVANIELARGRHAAALKLYSESLEIRRALASELGTPGSRWDMSVSLNKVADIELARGRHAAALKLYSESLELGRALASELGTPGSRRDMSVSLNKVANIELARGRHDAALKLYSESLELRRALASELGTPGSRRDVSASLDNVANIELARGRHDAALKLYSESLELTRALASELGTPGSRRGLSVSMDNVARIEHSHGHHDAALKLFSESLELRRALASELETPESRRNVAVSLSNVAKIELARGCHEAALNLYSESLELSRALASELGTPESRRDLSVSMDNVAQIQLARGHHDAALKLYSESLELRRALASELGTPESRRDLCVSMDHVANIERARGRHDPASKLYTESLELRRALASELGTPESRRDLSVSLGNVAQIELAHGRHDTALKLCSGSLELSRALASELGTTESRRDVMVSLSNVAQIELSRGHNDAALKLYNESLELSRALASELGTLESKFDLAVSHTLVARVSIEVNVKRERMLEARALIVGVIEVVGNLPRYSNALRFVDERLAVLK